MLIKQMTRSLAFAVVGISLSASAVVTKPDVEPGVFCTDLTKAQDYAVAHKMPLFAFYGTEGCAYCEKGITALETSTFTTWQAKRKIVMAFVHVASWSDDWKWKFCSDNWKVDLFPACRIWWPKTGSATSGCVGRAFLGRRGKVGAEGQFLQDQMINMIESYIKDWSSAPPTSSFALSATAATVKEGDSRTFSVTRTGGTAALSVDLTIDAKSGVTFDDGKLAKKLSWAANATGAKSFKLKTPFNPEIGKSVSAVVTMAVPASTKDVPTENKTPKLTVTVTDSFVEDYEAWVADIPRIDGDWASDDKDVLSVTPPESGTASIDIKVAKTGLLAITLDKANTATVNASVGGSNCIVGSDGASIVGVNAGQILTLSATGNGKKAVIEKIELTALPAPTLQTPKANAGISKEDLKKDSSLVTFSWSKVANAQKYVLTVGGKTVTTDKTSVNGIQAGLVSAEGAGDTAYTWSVAAVHSEGLDAGGPVRAVSATGKFTLTVYPTFNLPVSDVTVYKKASNKVSAAASGAPGITYSLAKGSSLPRGLSLDPKTGMITGTPTQTLANRKVEIVATSSNGHSAQTTITLSVAAFPKGDLKGTYVGVEENADGLAVAAFTMKISTSGKVSLEKVTKSGKSKMKGGVSVDYTTGVRKYAINSLDGSNWAYDGKGFAASGLKKVVKQVANAQLNTYSNLGVCDQDGNICGYLTVKVTLGRKAKIAGYVNGVKINSSSVLVVSGSTGKAFFGTSSVFGGVVVTPQGAGLEPSFVSVGGKLCYANGCAYPDNMDVSFAIGYLLVVDGKGLPVSEKSGKLVVAKGNPYDAKLTWTKKTGVFKGKFDGISYRGAFAKVGGVWIGCGSIDRGGEVVEVGIVPPLAD